MAVNTTLDVAKKVLFMGLGATVITVERLREMIGEMVSQGDLSQQEGNKLFDEIKGRVEEERGKLEARIKETVDKVVRESVEKMGLVTRQEFDAFKAEMRAQAHQHDAHGCTHESHFDPAVNESPELEGSGI